LSCLGKVFDQKAEPEEFALAQRLLKAPNKKEELLRWKAEYMEKG
jgi:hypothetical protein